MAISDHPLTQIGPVFNELALAQELILSLGSIRALTEMVNACQQLHIQMAGICGTREGITLESYLGANNTFLLVSSEGLYGLKNASKNAEGLTCSCDITLPLSQLSEKSLVHDSECTLMLKPRIALPDKEPLFIRQVCMFANNP